MVCVYCGGQTEVTNSRPQKKNNQVWRRRRCAGCGAVFTTQEAIQYESVWQVRHEGRLRPFSRQKLFLSLYKSCEHRKTALSDAEGLTETALSKLPALMHNGVVDSKDIARIAQVALNRFDVMTSIRYQAFHEY